MVYLVYLGAAALLVWSLQLHDVIRVSPVSHKLVHRAQKIFNYLNFFTKLPKFVLFQFSSSPHSTNTFNCQFRMFDWRRMTFSFIWPNPHKMYRVWQYLLSSPSVGVWPPDFAHCRGSAYHCPNTMSEDDRDQMGMMMGCNVCFPVEIFICLSILRWWNTRSSRWGWFSISLIIVASELEIPIVHV